MNGQRTSDLLGDFDAYGMPVMPQQGQRSSGLMGRLRKAQSKSHVADQGGDDDDDVGLDPGPGFPGLSIREMNNLGDRHRYPTMDSQSRTMSMASNGTYDTTPIIPMLGSQSGFQTKKNGNVQYRQRMIDQRKQLLSSDTGLPMPGAPGTQPPKANNQRTMSGLSHDPFQGFSNRTMSLSSQRGSRTLSMKNASSPQVGWNGPGGNYPGHGHGPGHGPGPGPGPHTSYHNGQNTYPNGHLTPNAQSLNNSHTMLASPSSSANSARRSEVDAAHEEIRKLRAELDKRKSVETQSRNSELRDLQQKYADLLSQQEQTRSQHSNVVDQFNQLSGQYEALRHEHSKLSDEHMALEGQHRALNDSHLALEDQHQALNDSHLALENQHQALNDSHQALGDQHRALSGSHAALEESQESQAALQKLQDDHSALGRSYANLEQQHNDLQDKYEQLLYQHADAQHLDTAHRELQTKYTALEKSLQAPSEHEQALVELQNTHQSLLERHEQLAADHQALAHEHRALEARGPTAPAESETINELRKVNEQLAGEIHVLSIELAESARRELQLPSNTKPDTAAGQLSRLEAELAYERTRRLQAEKHLHVPTDHKDLARSHAEATQLLDMRNQEYDMLQARLHDALEGQKQEEPGQTSRDVDPDTSGAPNAGDLDLQYRQLYQHTNFVEQENARLQKMLDEVSDRGPLADRLKSAEDQRNVLQEALRTLRERKDHEIRLLLDRSRQLEARLERPRLASGSSSRVYSNSRSSVSSDNSQELNGDLTYSSETDKPLEPPRMRSAPRPASPLHINFNMGDMYPEHRGRTEQRTSPLPLALGN